MDGATKGNKFFNHDAAIGIIGRGETVEVCFADIAHTLFSLIEHVDKVHPLQIITFEFEENNVEHALLIWLNTLLIKAKVHQMSFGDFRLKRDGSTWKATVGGEPWGNNHLYDKEVKEANPEWLSVTKIDHQWEARCVVTPHLLKA